MVGKITSDEKLSGSQAPTLLGVNPFQTRNDLLNEHLWIRGVEGASEPPKVEGEHLEWGNIHEPQIIKMAVKKLALGIGETE